MKLHAGWYVVGERGGRVLAVIAGPVQARDRAEALLPGASAAAAGAFTLDGTETFAVAWIAYPSPLVGACNAQLWVNPEFQEYDT